MNIAQIENKLIVASERVGLAVYDFAFELHFACSHPHRLDSEHLCVLRVGAVDDYEAEYKDKLALRLRLINTSDEHGRASELARWYPLISDLTPRSKLYEALPTAAEIEVEFSWPIFLKGSRQTSKHDASLSIIRSREHYAEAAERYRDDPILYWQKPVVREFIPLAPVAGGAPGKLPPSVEYRSFWLRDECVGWGRYWWEAPPYDCDDAECGLAVAREAAGRLNVPFLVVDFAKTTDGRWIVIECNDAQESGYAGVSPRLLWQAILNRLPA